MAMSGRAYSVFIGTTLQNLCSVDTAGHHQKELLNPRNRTQGIPPDETLISCKYDMTLNSAGSCTFVMPPKHPYIPDINPMETLVGIAEIDNIVWIGRVTDIKTDFYGRLTANCEDAFAWLNDSVQPYESYRDLSNRDYLGLLLENHNAQIGHETDDSKFQIHLAEVDDLDHRFTGALNYETTMELIQQYLREYGGYMRTVLSNNGDISLLWTKRIPRVDSSEQSIEFGKNLLDFSKSIDFTDVFTHMLPIGADVEMEVNDVDDNGNQIFVDDAGNYMIQTVNQSGGIIYVDDNGEEITPSGAPKEATKIIELPLTLAMEEDETVEPDDDGNKPLRFVYSKSYNNSTLAERFEMISIETGANVRANEHIRRVVRFNDAYDYETLYTKANEWLVLNKMGGFTVVLTAADLRFLDEAEGRLYLGMEVPVNSLPHNFSEPLVITKIEADIVKVSKKITLGQLPEKTLSDIAGRGTTYSTGVTLKKAKRKSAVTAKSDAIWFIPK